MTDHTDWGLPDRAVVTADEIATGAMISGATVRKACRDGKVRAFRVGKHWRIKRGDAIAWLEQEASIPSANTGSSASETDGPPSGTTTVESGGVIALPPRQRAKPDRLLSATLAGKS